MLATYVCCKENMYVQFDAGMYLLSWGDPIVNSGPILVITGPRARCDYYTLWVSHP